MHMPPFGARINVNLHGIEFERAAFTGFGRSLGWFLRRADKPLVLLREKRLLFSNRRGNPYSENKVVQKRLWPILDALSIPRCGMHAFRHGHGSLMHSSGASLKVAEAQLRHADASTTSRYYLHVLGSEQRDAAEKVARILCPDVAKPERKSVHVN